ncbi:Beta-glucuronidase [Grifola frondosa]|uniref:Beta-glucuronidase n=1 Tax=Grifola frondosa TaxID=5627 RepID=A0A1C7MK09_GRIFR|nr:Beta-glucuronidase [Grifola frondosa]
MPFNRNEPVLWTCVLRALCFIVPFYVYPSLAAVDVSPPSNPPSADANVIYSNFLGISFELSFINYYFGNSTEQVPQPVVDYLIYLHNRGSGKPLRLRLGGNSMDSSTYDPSQQTIIEFTDPAANSNDQSVSFGPSLFDVMNTVSTSVGDVQYLIGLSLRTPNSTDVPLLAGDAQKALGDDLDAFLLGNEPDLYASHGDRPGQANYTVSDYIGDYSVVFENLEHTAQGDILSLDKIAGPTICCAWDLASVLQSGWLSQFADDLKYITLQHYPRTFAAGPTNTASWQGHGLQVLKSSPTPKPLLMDEFNSASCGGIPNISNTFAASLWTSDYSLQMASVGYAGAYLHTRERGVTYNLFDPPDAVAGGPGAWTTNPSFYGMLPVAEALQSGNGSRVVDLNLQNSMQDSNATVAGYAIYDGIASSVNSLVLFNFANVSGATSDFALSGSFFPAAANVTVRYLTAPSVNEKTDISWGEETWAGVTDGKVIAATSASTWADRNPSCSGGCTIQVPGPAIAVVFIGTATADFSTPNSTASGSGSSGSGSGNGGNNTRTSDAVRFGASFSCSLGVFISAFVTLL